jgi:NAD(P)-dependent dehydrogenase (short-subunit alcohol dehydrogenase family)
MEPRTRPVAIVTGGSQGLGLALAETLVIGGWAVVIDARRGDRLDQARRRLASPTRSDAGGAQGPVVAIAGDVTDPVHRRALARSARQLGPIRLLVNNASTLGASPLPPLATIDLDVLRRTFDVNVVAPVAMVQELADDLEPGATIVNVTSDAAVGAYSGWGAYGASKAALDQASAVLAAEHPDWRVLSVDPGDMRTEMHQDAFPGEDISDRPEPARSVAGLLALILGGQPSGRYQARDLPAVAS